MCETRPFSWTEDRDDIVLPEQPETACYLNVYGFVVIRQNGWPDDEDAIVKIDPHNVPLLVSVMLEKAQEAEAAAGVEPASPPRAEARPCARQPEPQGRASDAPSVPLRQHDGEATGDLLEGIAHG